MHISIYNGQERYLRETRKFDINHDILVYRDAHTHTQSTLNVCVYFVDSLV